MLISVKLLTKYVIITYATEKFGVCIKAFPRRSKGEIPDRASRQNERMSLSKLKKAFLTDSDAEPFMYCMYLIQCIRFGSRKVRHLNRA